MSPPARRNPRLRHVSVRLRVSVDPEVFVPVFGSNVEKLEEDVRNYVLDLVQNSTARRERAIVGARRDQL